MSKKLRRLTDVSTLNCRKTFFIGNGWKGTEVHNFMIEDGFTSMMYDIISINDRTYIETWIYEVKEYLLNKGYKTILEGDI